MNKAILYRGKDSNLTYVTTEEQEEEFLKRMGETREEMEEEFHRWVMDDNEYALFDGEYECVVDNLV